MALTPGEKSKYEDALSMLNRRLVTKGAYFRHKQKEVAGIIRNIQRIAKDNKGDSEKIEAAAEKYIKENIHNKKEYVDLETILVAMMELGATEPSKEEATAMTACIAATFGELVWGIKQAEVAAKLTTGLDRIFGKRFADKWIDRQLG